MPAGRNEYMGIQGTGLKTKNDRLRFFAIIFGGIIAFGAIFYWRQQTFKQSEYVAFPMRDRQGIAAELKSENFQLEVQDSSPTAR